MLMSQINFHLVLNNKNMCFFMFNFSFLLINSENNDKYIPKMVLITFGYRRFSIGLHSVRIFMNNVSKLNKYWSKNFSLRRVLEWVSTSDSYFSQSSSAPRISSTMPRRRSNCCFSISTNSLVIRAAIRLWSGFSWSTKSDRVISKSASLCSRSI